MGQRTEKAKEGIKLIFQQRTFHGGAFTLLFVFRAKREQKFGSCRSGVGGRMESQDLPGGISIHQLAVGKCGLREGDAF